MNLAKWEKIVPLLLITVFMAASPASVSNIHKKCLTTIAIDAGHGGNDPGCMVNGVREKDVTLSIALALGSKLKKQLPDVKIIYTRATDVFIPLSERAAIANKNHADIFISIHCNATKNTEVHGTETFALGLHKAEDNLEVAERENEVVLLEDNYKQKYEGFDPSSPESHIYFSLFQNAYMDQSLKLASKIENQFTRANKIQSRGVKQAGFVVLWKTKMPSILIETGFLSNKNDRAFLSSPKGVDEMSGSIAASVVDYKKFFESLSSSN